MVAGTGVLVISPTRELCMQTFSVAEVFAKQHKLSYGLVTGGANRGGEAAALKQVREEPRLRFS